MIAPVVDVHRPPAAGVTGAPVGVEEEGLPDVRLADVDGAPREVRPVRGRVADAGGGVGPSVLVLVAVPPKPALGGPSQPRVLRLPARLPAPLPPVFLSP